MRAQLERAKGDRWPDGQAAGEDARRRERSGSRATRRAPRRRDHLRGDRDRLPVRRRGPRLQEPRRPSPTSATRRSPARSAPRPAHEAGVPPRSRHGERVATFATATPIANSITEAHVMQPLPAPRPAARGRRRALRRWAATFGQTVTEIEMAPTGGGNYRINTRFARFQNVPEMLRMWHVFADVKTAEDLNLPARSSPSAPTGSARPETRRDPPAPRSPATCSELADRAEKVRGRASTPSEDNMLKITGDGRNAALDMRLVSGQPASSAGQARARRRQHRAPVARRTAATSYLDPVTGQPSPRPAPCRSCSATCPLRTGSGGTPTRSSAAARRPGRPAEQVRFVHEARNDAEKARLFAGVPRRARRGPDRLDGEDGRRDQHPGPVHRDSPPRLPVAAGGHRAARRPHPAPGQPEPRDPDLPLRRRRQLRRLQLADRRAQGPVHRPGHARPPRRPRDRGHRRQHAQLRRGQSARLRRPADPRQSQDRRRSHPPSPPRARLATRPAHPQRHHRRRARTAPGRSPSRSPPCARPPRSAPTPAATSSA